MPLTLNDPIRTERLTLRRISREDLPALSAYYTDPVYLQYLPNPAWQDAADGERWFERTLALQKDGAALQLAIEHADGTILGICLLFKFDDTANSAELGYALGPAHWGKGYAREAIGALLTFAFGAQGLRRIEATIDPRNAASRKVLAHFGFSHEGTLRERTVMKEQLVDSAIYGLLRREWLARQAGASG